MLAPIFGGEAQGSLLLLLGISQYNENLKKKLVKKCLFIFEKRDSVSGGGAERERETESEAPGSRLRAVSTEPDEGLELTDREIMT